jgi:hypothetical protein
MIASMNEQNMLNDTREAGPVTPNHAADGGVGKGGNLSRHFCKTNPI